MNQSHQLRPLGFGKPAVYRIAVQGQLDRRTAADIADARIEANDTHTTTLRVRVLDQAGLTGVLDALHGLHLPILAVQFVRHGEETNNLG